MCILKIELLYLLHAMPCHILSIGMRKCDTLQLAAIYTADNDPDEDVPWTEPADDAMKTVIRCIFPAKMTTQKKHVTT